MHVMPDDDVFFITDVKPVDMGVYSCTAKNTAGTVSANATLTVLGKSWVWSVRSRMRIFIFCFLASCGLAASQVSEVTVRGQRRGSRGITEGSLLGIYTTHTHSL